MISRRVNSNGNARSQNIDFMESFCEMGPQVVATPYPPRYMRIVAWMPSSA